MKRATALLLSIALVALTSGAASAADWFAKGDFYCVPGCWNNDGGNELFDDGLHGDGAAADGVFGGTVVTDATAGRKEFKIARADWSEAHPGGNAWVHVAATSEAIHFTLDTNAHGDGWLPDQNIVWSSKAFPVGTTFEVIGSAPETGSWGSGVPATLIGDIWTRVVTIATAGSHGVKFRATGSWDICNMGSNGLDPGGSDIAYTTTVANTDVLFEFNQATGRVRATVLGATPTLETSWGRVKAIYR